jgi:phosphate transport system substrate-binding protein
MASRFIGAGLLALALTACQSESGQVASGARDQIRVVGSSTVYPFTTAVAEQLVRKLPQFKPPVVESTGTGAGIKLFCTGVGTQFPDVVNASRRMKKSEYDNCAANGVKNVIEVQVGVDGLVFAESGKAKPMDLTREDIYKALAAKPFGKDQTAKTWADVNPALPAIAIRVYGPPPTSGTRDSLTELVMAPGCDSDPAMKALKTSNEDQHKELCTKIREDGAYVEAGENDNLIVQKVEANPGSIGAFGFSFLEENLDKVRGVKLNGVEPTYESVSSFEYPGARPLYIYVKGEHLAAVPGLKEFVAEYAQESAWGPQGYLARRGLVSAPDDVRASNAETAIKLNPLDPKGLK